ncbi:winged helix-turn-helix domain-containing protein [Pseudoalteromonas rubra]|uniref:OmpR/PhoB-type domain-containing protein n=1 Tax=Pseudoalteromonas rubra TaxID=43658 RepID=A0A5S3WXY2_9GAMM|nr:winged helix-turn-helix domain-containing protein [Pseudoalteromonas rubra]TMP34776.1 hypothetical protein CWB98_17420 [Pseudoalteromonas rubra]
MSSLTDTKLTKLGAFVLDLGDQVLYLDSQEVSIEPKVMALLLYLYDNRDRYVSIEELHQQVWSDRIVSDTAVRSAAKKLRLILGDNDIANARYVKSVSKRGYKLVCEIAPVDALEPCVSSDGPEESTVASPPDTLSGVASEPLVSSEPPQSLPPVSEPAQLASPPKERTWQSWKFNVLLILATVIAMFVGWVKYEAVVRYIQEIQVVKVDELEHITEFNGDKEALSVSEDGRFIAFTGRTSEDEDRQVFLLDKQNNKTRQLTFHASNAMFVQFAQNDKVLIYSDVNEGKMSMELLPLTLGDPESGKVTLIEGVVAIGGPSRGRHSSEILLPMLVDLESEMTLYALDIPTRKYTRMLALSDASEILIDVSLSPDKKKLALMKQIKGQFHILLFDLATKEETLVYTSKYNLLGVEWKSDRYILVLGSGGVVRIDSITGEHLQVIDDSERLLRGFNTHNGEEIILLQKETTRANRLYIEHTLGDELTAQQTIDTAPEVVSMLYDTRSEQHRWVRTLEDGVMTIGRMTLGTQEVEPYYTTEERLLLLDVSYEAGGILMKEGPKLAFYSFDRGQVDYITSSKETSSDAAFSLDGKHIYYGVNVVGEWEIQSYNIQTKTSRLMLPGYRSIRAAGSGYIAAEPIDAKLFYFSDLKEPGQALGHPIDFRHICRWYIRGDHIIWTAFDERHTHLHKLNWRTGEHSQFSERLFAFYPAISTDQKGEKTLSMSVQINNTSIATTTIKH